MGGLLDHSSAWNKHQGVGATLLDNWVEERAVGDKIIKERSDNIFLSKYGHAVCILVLMGFLVLVIGCMDALKNTRRDRLLSLCLL